MTYPLDVKLGQMVMVGFRGATRDAYGDTLELIDRHQLGGVWLTDNDSPMGRTRGNIQSPEQLRTLTADLRTAAAIPLFIAIDAEGGEVIRLKESYGFPRFDSPRQLGERDDPAHTCAFADHLADTLAACGINFNFAPVLDLAKNPANPIIAGKQRAISRDPEAVARHAAAIIEAHHGRGILCAGKHFPGHGSSVTDSHKGLVDVTDTWGDDELIPYRRLIERCMLDAVLSAHVFLRQFDADRPATLAPAILTGILRKGLGFDGVVFTDDLNMGAIQQHYPLEQAVALCVEAGADVVLHANVDHYDPATAAKTIAILRRLVESGRIREERIDESFQRIMRLKSRLGSIG